MSSNRRDELKTPEGKKRVFTTGGKAGRTPGLGSRNNTGTKPGQGIDRPSQGYALASEDRRKPPPGTIPQPKVKPEDET